MSLRGRRRIALALLAITTGACSDDESIDRARYVVRVETTACGDASKTSGSGVIVGSDTVVTAAHVVVGATNVTVDGRPARIDVLDTERDLARLHVDGVGHGRQIALADATAGERVTIASSADRGPIIATVTRRTDLAIEEVRGDRRVVRDGYELRADTGAGDSGAGVFSDADELIGVLFATSNDREDVSYATAAPEIEHVLDRTAETYVCDPADSRVDVDG